jgi:hypothetical protein
MYPIFRGINARIIKSDFVCIDDFVMSSSMMCVH